MPRVPGCEAVYDVANQWRERCLKADGSLLWPDLDEPTWTAENLAVARDVMDELVSLRKTRGSHMKERITSEPDQVKRAIADATAIWEICPGDVKVEERKGFANFVASWVTAPSVMGPVDAAIEVNIGAKESDWFKPGFQLQRGAHLRFILEVGRRVKADSADPDSYLEMRRLAQGIHLTFPRSASAKNMVLYMLFPDETEPIFNNWARERIVEAPKFAHLHEGLPEWDDKFAAIRRHFESSNPEKEFDFYEVSIRDLWRPPSTASELETDDSTVSLDIPGVIGTPNASIASSEQLVAFTHLAPVALHAIESLIRTKKQIILEGPPGSGKTYVARLFARYLAGLQLDGAPDDHVEIVQFHQSYGYEDFVAGIRPVTGANGQLTYETRPGIFLEMCLRAQQHPDDTYVLIIDEINRANLSRIFGELLYGLEYRDQPVRMQYPVEIDGAPIQHLTIPDNLYLIGTMNSTDRSLAMIDYALRRRFYFWRLMPTEHGAAPVLERWLAEQDGISMADRAQLLSTFVTLNAEIAATLGPDYQIGHSYFMLRDGQIADPAAREQVWRYAIEPLLREYFHTRRDAAERIAALSTGFFSPPVAVDDVFESDELDS